VIVDDFPIGAAANARRELTLLQTLTGRLDASLLLTAYREPPPSLAGALALEASGVRPAPYFTEEQVGLLVAASGGNPASWSKPIHVFCSGGHPQLVAARITGLRLRGWPEAERFDDGPTGKSSIDTEAEREETRSRLVKELPEDARALLYRLSFLVGDFDRRLAIDVGAAPPAILQPGQALDILAMVGGSSPRSLSDFTPHREFRDEDSDPRGDPGGPRGDRG
jgi:hypothetical protein